MPVFPTKTQSKPAVYLPSSKKSVKQRKQYMSTCRLLTGSSKLPLILGYYYPCLSWVLKQRVQVWLFSVGYWWRGGSWHGSCRPSWVISSWRPRGLWGGCSCTPGCTHAVKKEYRISQRLIFNSVFYRYVELGKENPQHRWKWARVNRRISSHARFYFPLVKGLSYH